MKLFCVVPFFNEQQYLPACIRSISAQADKDFHLVLVDNSSTDDSKAVAQALIARLNIKNATVIAEPQKGTGSAADSGFRYAIKHGATHIARTDADCVADAAWIKEIKCAFNDDIELIWGKLGYRTDDLPVQIKDRLLFPLAVLISDIYGNLVWGGAEYKAAYRMGGGNNMAITAGLYQRTGGFPRKPLDVQDDDVALFDVARKLSSKVQRRKAVRSYTSLRRTRKYGYIRTMLYYWGRKYRPKEIDVR